MIKMENSMPNISAQFLKSFKKITNLVIFQIFPVLAEWAWADHPALGSLAAPL